MEPFAPFDVSQPCVVQDFPAVSIVIPCRDEERFLDGCLESLIANSYPQSLL